MSDNAIIDFAQRIKARDGAAVSNVGLAQVAPDQAARSNTLSRDMDIPADFVDRNLGAIEKQALQIKAREAIAKYPTIGVWASNPRHAAVGADDMDGLAKNARYWRDQLAKEGAMTAARAPAATFRNFFAGVWENFTQGGVTAKAGLQSAVADMFPTTSRPGGLGDFSQQNSLERFRRAQARADQARPNFESSTMSGLYSGVSSFAQMVPTVGVGLAVGAGAGLAAAAAPVGLTAYAKYRSRGASAGMAAVGGLGEGGVEAATELMPISFIVNSLGKIGIKPFIAGLLGSEVPGEQIATLAQDAIDTAIANPDKTWGQYLKERPDAAYQTFVATLVPGLLAGGASEIGRVVHERAQAQQAETDAAFLGKLATGVADSKTAKRDPSAFAKFLEIQAQGTPVENLFIPGDKLVEYFQSADIDWHGDGSGFDFAPGFGDQVDEAVATGGDVVIPTADFAAHLAGTPAWDALKDHVRMSPGGMSLSEAKDFATGHDDAMAKMGADFAAQFAADQAAMEPRQKLYQAVRDKLTNAGFTQSAADTNASLVAARYATRAARQGVDIKGDEFDQVVVNQVLPEKLAPIVAADQLDVVINAMKRDRAPASDAKRFGPSLLEWIAKQGGIEDKGGDLASMGLGDWHKGKPGRRKLLRETAGDSPTLIPMGKQNANTPDELALRAQEAGYLRAGERPSIADLHAAIDAEMHGKPVYAEDRSGKTDEVKAAADELAALLDQEGIDPATAGVADIRKAVARYQAERMAGSGYDQSFNEGPRGRITFPAAGFGTGPSVIDLFAARDPSTFLHETGHLWLEELRADATADGASDQIRGDWQTVQDWFVANGHDLSEGIPVDAHEMWARGVERFMMEGKAPSSTLRRVFDTFRSWLVSIYQVVNNLRAPITPEIRDVMARLVATDAEIAEARLDQRIKVMFDDAAMAGMTGPQYEAYRALASEARDEAFDALLFRTMATVRRQATKAWKDERDAVHAEVTADVDARPEFRALAMLGKDGVRIDRAWLVETYGEDALALMPKRVPPIYGDNGISADMIAEMNGFSTGDEMVRTLMAVGQRTQHLREGGDQRSVRAALIDEEVAAIMRDRHGDPLSDGSIEEQALTLIHNERQGEVIASELRELGKRSNQRPTPYALARQWAQETIAQSKVSDSLSGAALQRYGRAARNAAKLAEEAMLKGDVDEVFRQKQRQMLNNALIDEAGKAKAAIDAAVTKLAKVAKRATMKTVDQDYLDQAHALLEQVDFRNRPQSQIARRESFEAWAAQREAEGFDVVVPASFAETLGKDNWSRLTVENLLGLKDAVDQILHLGRLKQTLLDNKERRDFDAVVGEALGDIAKLPPKPPSDLMEPGFVDRFKAGVANFDASLLKVETIVDWLDGRTGGVFNRVVFKPISDAQDRENDMRADYQERVVKAMQAMPGKTIARWAEKVRLPELINRDTGQPWGMTRQQLVAMALNMGNEGNVQRLTDGYGWNEQAVRDALNRELTAEDWGFVQQVWDIVETLWPQIEAMEKRINGVAPEKVVATPIDTPHGTLRGGYYPAVYDSTKDIDAETNSGKESDLFETLYTKANTRASATKARSEKVGRPILLNLGVINRHLGEVIHDLTHREAIMNADKFLSDRRIMSAIDGTLGPEYRRMFRPWLKFVANQMAMDRAGNEGVGAIITKARTNATVVGMGFRIGTIMSQIAGYSNSAEYVGAKWVGQGIVATTRAPIETFNFVMERSGEIRHRMDSLDRDIRAGVSQLAGKSGFISEAQRFAFHGIGMADRLVVIPTWIGAYNKALAGGASEEAAIYEADKAVRKSQGSGSAKDMAAIQRGTGKYGELIKLMTMFYSYMSALYQRQRTLGRDMQAAQAVDMPALMSRALWLIIVPPVLSGILAGRGPDDGEDWAVWSFKQMLFNTLGPIPIVRDLAQPLWDAASGNKGFDYQLSPIQRAGQTTVAAVKDLGHIARGEDTKRATRDAMETAGYFTGLIPGQIAASTQFLVDVAQGDQSPETVSDWWQGLTKGKISE